MLHQWGRVEINDHLCAWQEHPEPANWILRTSQDCLQKLATQQTMCLAQGLRVAVGNAAHAGGGRRRRGRLLDGQRGPTGGGRRRFVHDGRRGGRQG